jgi:hypothetical protein
MKKRIAGFHGPTPLSFVGAQLEKRLPTMALVFFLNNAAFLLQRVFPLALPRGRHQPIRGIDSLVAPLGPRAGDLVIGRLFTREEPEFFHVSQGQSRSRAGDRGSGKAIVRGAVRAAHADGRG